MKKYTILIFAAMVFLPSMMQAQEKSELSVSTDIVSRYVWRGLEFGNSPAIQPTIEYNVGKFTAGFWGSYATNGANVQEADLYLSYSPIEALSITFTDYFFPDHTIASNNYFEYDPDKTAHIFEGMLSFNGTEKIPVSLSVAVNFFGADARNAEGDMFYSTYAELGYSTELNGTPLDFFLGFTPNDADEELEEVGFYGNGPGVINIGMTASKELKISDSFIIPLTGSLIFNPQAENVFMLIGLSL